MEHSKGKIKAYDNREILQRYCPHIDDNVVVAKSIDGNSYECMSCHLCASSEAGAECKNNSRGQNSAAM